MKNVLRLLFSPILNIFEQGDGPYEYKPLNHKILLFIGFIFGVLASVLVLLIPDGMGISSFIPVIVFGLVSLVALVVGLLGNERAVTKIWGDR